MMEMTARDGDVKYERVNKTTARKAWDEGKPVVLCPVKLYPFGGFRPSCMIQRDVKDEESRKAFGLNVDDFNAKCTDFIWYNCQLFETGYYPSYWVKVE
jgi:hypothetical protein